MKSRAFFTLIGMGAITALSIGAAGSFTNMYVETGSDASATPTKVRMSEPREKFDGAKIVRSDAEWKKILTPEQYFILREAGTEQPYTGTLEKNHKNGTYYCAACHLALFRSRAKFDSGTGWPSFYEPIYKKNVIEEEDRSIGETRTAVSCARCGGHIGHVFDDGPEPTGLRYCINSAALKFEPSK